MMTVCGLEPAALRGGRIPEFLLKSEIDRLVAWSVHIGQVARNQRLPLHGEIEKLLHRAHSVIFEKYFAHGPTLASGPPSGSFRYTACARSRFGGLLIALARRPSLHPAKSAGQNQPKPPVSATPSCRYSRSLFRSVLSEMPSRSAARVRFPLVCSRVRWINFLSISLTDSPALK